MLLCSVAFLSHADYPDNGIDPDSINISKVLRNNAPETFQTEGLPLLSTKGKDGKFVFGVGGFVKVIAGWDFGYPIKWADEFITSEIPMDPGEERSSRFDLSAKQTHLYLNFVAFPMTKNAVGAFVSANLLDGYKPRLQFAYLKYRGLQAGYDYSLFSDPACGSPTVDFEGPSSNTANPVPGINYTWHPDSSRRWEMGIGMELPLTSFTTTEGRTEWVSQRFPDIPLEAKYAWNEGASWVRGSAILRMLTYRNMIERSNHNRFGYGFQLSGVVNFLEKLTFHYQGVWGKGISSNVQDALNQCLDLAPTGNGDTLSPVMLWGTFASMQYDISSRFNASLSYSQLRTYVPFYTEGSISHSDQLRYTQYVAANIFCKITSIFTMGLEYIWGRRVNYDGLKHADNRLQLAFTVQF